MEKLKDINEIKHTLVDAVKAEVAMGVQNVDTAELGAVVDMIKDLAEAEKACMEACYYETVTEAMSDDGEGYGYDRWRYSSGRFAPKGRGSRTYGYLPGADMRPDEPREWPMGYRPETDRRPMPAYGYHEGEPKDRMDKAIEAIGDIWAEADADTKEKMRTAVKDLLYQMEQAM